jgi:A/G-specific adenine glycosylase
MQRSDGAVWLQRRPNTGIWAGLYAPPVYEDAQSLHDAMHSAQAQVQVQVRTPVPMPVPEEQPAFKHVLTHRDIYLHPVLVPWSPEMGEGFLEGPGRWCLPKELGDVGLPAPVRTWLSGVAL